MSIPLNLDIHIDAQPLTPLGFAPFGGVISSRHQTANMQNTSANQGTAIKLCDVSPVANHYAECPSGKQARARLNLFRCTPPALLDLRADGLYYPAKVLEKHPFSTQTFMPMGRAKHLRAYMVIVAPTGADGLPDLVGLRAFVANGDQAVTYGVGTWHAPMIALDDVTDFAVLIHENGVHDEDCQEVPVSGPIVCIKSAA